jgi:hypothetical protein
VREGGDLRARSPPGTHTCARALDRAHTCLTARRAPCPPRTVPSSVTLLGGEAAEGALANATGAATALLLLGVHVRDAMSSLLLLDLQEPLDVALRRVTAASCAERAGDGGSAAGECARWHVLRDGEVDAVLERALAAG